MTLQNPMHPSLLRRMLTPPVSLVAIPILLGLACWGFSLLLLAPESKAAARSAAARAQDTAPPQSKPWEETTPAARLLSAIAQGEFTQRDHVTTGRFLRKFDQLWRLAEGVDTSRSKIVRRTVNSVEFEAPYAPVTSAWEKAQVARARLVKSDDRWKLEDLRILRTDRSISPASN